MVKNIYTSHYLILSVIGKLKRNGEHEFGFDFDWNTALLHPYRTTTQVKVRWMERDVAPW